MPDRLQVSSAERVRQQLDEQGTSMVRAARRDLPICVDRLCPSRCYHSQQVSLRGQVRLTKSSPQVKLDMLLILIDTVKSIGHVAEQFV